MSELPLDLEEPDEPADPQPVGARISNFLTHQLDRLQPSSQLVLVVTALVVGIGAGIGAVIFRYLINGVQWVGYVWFPSITENWAKHM